jgi:hypothetical protein
MIADLEGKSFTAKDAKDAEEPPKLGWLGMRAWKSFGFLVDAEGDVISTANNQNGATALAFPDLTAIPGFFPTAPAGTTISWFAATLGGTTQFYVVPAPIPQTISRASSQGTYTEP